MTGMNRLKEESFWRQIDDNFLVEIEGFGDGIVAVICSERRRILGA